MIDLIVTADTLTQRHLEAFARAYRAALPEKSTRVEERGATVRAAAAGGWFGDALTADGVSDLPAREVRRLSDAVNEVYAGATTPDPKASSPPPPTETIPSTTSHPSS